MRSVYLFFFLLSISSCQSNDLHDTEQHELVDHDTDQNRDGETNVPKRISGLSFPNWIEGVWQNTFESNSNNSITYAFYSDQLRILHGMNHESSEEKNETYSNYTIKEEASDSTYSIQLETKGHSIEYAFILRNLEWTSEPSLTFSITEDGELKRAHLTSVQLILMKIKTAQ